MSHDIAALLGDKGAATMVELITRVSRRSVVTWLQQGRLVRLHHGVVALPERADEWMVRAHAGVLYTAGVLSHTSALAMWGVVDARQHCLHVSVPTGRGLRGCPGLVIHRRRSQVPGDRPFDVTGLPVTSLDRALLDSWGLLSREAAPPDAIRLARAAVINAVRAGRTTAGRLMSGVESQPNLAGRSDLSALLGLIARGCHSELELWGLRHVLTIDGLPQPRRQFRVDIPTGSVYLDAALAEVKLGIELDGAAFHGSRSARERDIARDAALAGLGWQILRFSYRRLTEDPDGCRRDIESAYQRRR